MRKHFLATLLASVTLATVSLSASSSAAYADPGAAFVAPSTSYIAGAQQTITDSYVSARFGVAKPVLTGGDAQSATLMLVNNGAGDQISIGWSVNPALNGDNEPHLFTYWWKKSVGQCYNTACAGYTPYPSAVIKVGQKLTPGITEKLGIEHWGTRWWLWVGTDANDSEVIGYFEDSIWSTAWPTFSSVSLYGGIDTENVNPTSQMGNGLCAENPDGLKIGSVTYSTSATVNLSTFATRPRLYSAKALSARTFRYGGSGSCS